MSCQIEARLRAKATIAVSDLAYAAHMLSIRPESPKRVAKVARAKEGKQSIATLMSLHTSECETCINSETTAA